MTIASKAGGAGGRGLVESVVRLGSVRRAPLRGGGARPEAVGEDLVDDGVGDLLRAVVLGEHCEVGGIGDVVVDRAVDRKSVV